MKREFPDAPVTAGPYLSTREVAVMIGRHQSTAVDYVNQGIFANVYLDKSSGSRGMFKVPQSDVLHFLHDHFQSFDSRLRRAAQTWLAVRTNDGRDSISYLDLEDFEFEGTRLPLKSRQRGIWKPRQLDAALSIATTFRRPGQDRPYEDEVGPDGMLRYKWQGEDSEASDNRALRAAMKENLPLIWFFGVAPGLFQPVFPVFLIDEEMDKHQFIVDIDPQREFFEGDVDLESPLEVDAVKRYGTRIARTRLHQRLFRSTVINAYGTRCAICNLRHSILLDAAHIIPDSREDSLPTVVNGMAMCKIHHAAFDAKILGIRPDLIVEIRDDILAEIDGPMLKHGLQERHRQKLMSVPTKKADRPSPSLLEEAYSRFKEA
ncbi:putative restriction endonuclease [Arthrobacter oryzae]|uniref:HNH endonuclease n=1 Tax=Arthrobacter oryzae TaxID=409290 RepID=UPI00277E97CB|nr:HNH endonuclease [Arthrobacter oryzae]MDP9988457.1 putative restriction endonuclease [Arthrobacter oryzae]